MHALLGEYAYVVKTLMRRKHFVKKWKMENQERHMAIKIVLKIEELEQVSYQIVLGELFWLE